MKEGAVVLTPFPQANQISAGRILGIIPARFASTRFPGKPLALIADEMSKGGTAMRKPEEYGTPNVVKVVVNVGARALYFARRTIPYVRGAVSGSVSEQLAAFPFLKHLGIYGYRRETLLRLVKFPVSPLENAEKLEQLRALENGIQIAVVKVDYDSIGVDMPEDVAKVEKILTTDGHR